MARPLNPSVSVRILIILSAIAMACGREAPPRDYQNSPPAMTHPVDNSTQSPTAQGMPGAAPEPNKGVEGKNITRQPANATGATPKLKDQPPTELGPPPANSQHATQTTSTAVTGTHLATPP